MKYWTPKNELIKNADYVLKFNSKVKASSLDFVCSCYYTIFCDGKVVDFGPDRCAAFYQRTKHVVLPNYKELIIKISYSGFDSFEFAETRLYFGVTLFDENSKKINRKMPFKVYFGEYHDPKSCKYSFQRGLVEIVDVSIKSKGKIELIETIGNTDLGKVDVNCDFIEEKPLFKKEEQFKGFDKLISRNFYSFEMLEEANSIKDIDKIFDELVEKKSIVKQYEFAKEYTGLLKLKFKSRSKHKFVIVFDEYLPNGEWWFGRNNCTDMIEVHTSKGEFEYVSRVPYSMKHIRVISDKTDDIEVSLIRIENNRLIKHEKTGDKNIDLILEASERTFSQNAYDIFTDCPSRERAGWLCDSYFEGIAESFYLKSRNIEKKFLENYIYSNSKEIDEGMLPMCYPAYHQDHLYIPNWGLWFIVELAKYYSDTKDRKLIKKALQKVDNLFNFFKKYENEFGLLMNLPGWVFVEWSEANSDDFLKGINFPSNMLYSKALIDAGHLFKNKEWVNKGKALIKVINRYAKVGKYYVDNAMYIDGVIKPCKNHKSETCQYYALFFGINRSEKFKNLILNQKDNSALSPSAPFIGKILRLILLEKDERYAQLIEEYVDYFSFMANETGTLWEKVEPRTSCNHGFTSIVGPIIYNAYLKSKKDENI